MTQPNEEIIQAQPLPKGVNPENALYEAWKVSEPWQRPEIEKRLLQHLRSHASKICWMVLHSHQPHLIDEIATDTLMDLGSFEGRSMFSTWFHSRATKRCRMEQRTQIQRKTYSMESFRNLPMIKAEGDIEFNTIMRNLYDSLNDFDKRMIDLRVFDEYSDVEIGRELGMPSGSVYAYWKKLLQRLRIKYYGGKTA